MTNAPAVSWRGRLILGAWIFAGLAVGGLALFAAEGPRAVGLARVAAAVLARSGSVAAVDPVVFRWNQDGAAALRAYRFPAGQGRIALYVAAAGGVNAWRCALYGPKGQLVDEWPLDAAAAAAADRIPPAIARLYAAGAWATVPEGGAR